MSPSQAYSSTMTFVESMFFDALFMLKKRAGADSLFRLGKGSFATVLRATHRATGQVFAVKLINTKRFALSANQSTAKMFIREIEILLELHHVRLSVTLCALLQRVFL